MCVCLIFIFTCGIFLVYDQMVERRQNIVMTQAKKTGAIVSSLFPDSVTKRLLADNNKASSQERKFLSPNARLQSFLQSHGNDQQIMQAKPIADMFPYTTVVFAGTIETIHQVVILPVSLTVIALVSFHVSLFVCRYCGVHVMEFQSRSITCLSVARDNLQGI